MQIRIVKILSVLLFIISLSPVILLAKEKKQMRINWAEIKGVKKFRVEIKDENENIILDEETEVNYLDFILPVGKYQLRIGNLNKFNKISTWSDWQSIEIKIATKKHRRKSKGSKYKPKIYDLKLMKLGLGYSYLYLLPRWDNNYENSYINANLNMGIYFGGFNKLKNIAFFRYFGLEFEFHYMKFGGKKVNNVVSELQNIVLGFNLYFRTNFKFPINLIFRFGGGITYTIQEYIRYQPSGKFVGELTSLDYYYKPEIAVEFRASNLFYIEMGMGFISILYKDETLYSLKPFIMFGFTFDAKK